VLTLEWDARKASGNLRKHGVDFQEVATGLADPLSLAVRDPDTRGKRIGSCCWARATWLGFW
jgi:uncharacterized DUF497 family protein